MILSFHAFPNVAPTMSRQNAAVVVAFRKFRKATISFLEYCAGQQAVTRIFALGSLGKCLDGGFGFLGQVLRN